MIPIRNNLNTLPHFAALLHQIILSYNRYLKTLKRNRFGGSPRPPKCGNINFGPLFSHHNLSQAGSPPKENRFWHAACKNGFRHTFKAEVASLHLLFKKLHSPRLFGEGGIAIFMPTFIISHYYCCIFLTFNS